MYQLILIFNNKMMSPLTIARQILAALIKIIDDVIASRRRTSS